MEESEAPGWEAIDSAVEALYPGQKPRHWAAVLPAMLGGRDPLQGISAYAAEGPSHWHFVTYGLSELYDKTWKNPDLSGFGFELTFRLRRETGDEPAPWVFNFLQNLGRYVFSTGNGFEPGHYMDLNGPIALGVDTEIRAIGFVDDAELPAIATPNGRLRFLQVIGITRDELAAIKCWDAAKFLALLAAHIPKSVTDLARTSLLAGEAVATAVRAGSAADGSSTGVLYVAALSWRRERRFLRSAKTVLVLGANAIRDLGPVLTGRLPYGRSLVLLGPSAQVVFEPGSNVAVTEEQGDVPTVRVTLSPEHARELATLVKPSRGTYAVRGLPGLELLVEPSVIKTSEGKVAEVIG